MENVFGDADNVMFSARACVVARYIPGAGHVLFPEAKPSRLAVVYVRVLAVAPWLAA